MICLLSFTLKLQYFKLLCILARNWYHQPFQLILSVCSIISVWFKCALLSDKWLGTCLPWSGPLSWSSCLLFYLNFSFILRHKMCVCVYTHIDIVNSFVSFFSSVWDIFLHSQNNVIKEQKHYILTKHNLSILPFLVACVFMYVYVNVCVSMCECVCVYVNMVGWLVFGCFLLSWNMFSTTFPSASLCKGLY